MRLCVGRVEEVNSPCTIGIGIMNDVLGFCMDSLFGEKAVFSCYYNGVADFILPFGSLA